MQFEDLNKSVFSILRIQGGQARVVGTGFLINKDPYYLLTCNHVVSEGTEENNVNITYSITRRTDNLEVFDIRQAQVSFIRARKITFQPDKDLAVLQIDPADGPEIFALLDIHNSEILKLSFDNSDRKPGSEIEWLSTGVNSDLTLTPRFFKGNVVTSYIANQTYGYVNNKGAQIQQLMNDIRMIEVDQLFIPGSSGSAILNAESNRVIGFVHGFKSWPILTNTEITQPVEILQDGNVQNVNLKYKVPLVASLSLGVDVKSIEIYLKDNHFIGEY